MTLLSAAITKGTDAGLPTSNSATAAAIYIVTESGKERIRYDNGDGTWTDAKVFETYLTWSTTAVNKVWATPTGSPGVPAWRALAAADIPNLDTSKLTTGTLAIARGGTGAATASANTVFRGPTSGGAAAPSFGTLAAKELTRTVTTVSGNTTLDATHDIVLANTASGNITITLPTAVGFTGTYTVKNIGLAGHIVIMAATGGQTIDGAAGLASAYTDMQTTSTPNGATFASDNANWFIIGTIFLTA